MTPTTVAVAAVVGAPGYVLPWLDRIYDGNDVAVLLAAGGPAGLASVEPGRLERAVRRAVLDRQPEERGEVELVVRPRLGVHGQG